MPRSKQEEEVDVADQFLNYDGDVTTTVEAEGTSVDQPEPDISTTDKIEEQPPTSTPKNEQPTIEDPSNEKENKDPEEEVVQEQSNGNDKNEKDEDEAAEVYEVEAVLEHNKSKGKTYYLIKWKGYSQEESTWEDEDNVFAEDLVKDYWTKLNSEEPKVRETRKGRKRAATAPPPIPSKKETKKARMSTSPKKAKTVRVKIDEDFDHDEDWESLVSGVETVTRDDKSGELLVYLKWKNGDTSRHPAKEANIKCPQKMIKFYEQRLTFAAPQQKS
ncbi:19138_t:CDS:2 [Funneliformis geosporum]|uniref:13774_t:CDS:1 n=1 Tax=Funneliformis geosporum TaxID=1117311 RepID=A0A9W4SN31_9GLOM|nr:19138_t:CDS:2 [Funneliformis geosporum]CAI2174386.1 13774_t:CDS:2 [Funneliformis geosporum]